MGLFDILKSVASAAFNSGSEKMAGELGKKIIENKYRAAGHSDAEISEVQKVFTTGNANAMNKDVMMEEALKKQGYSAEQIKDFIAKTKGVTNSK